MLCPLFLGVPSLGRLSVNLGLLISLPLNFHRLSSLSLRDSLYNFFWLVIDKACTSRKVVNFTTSNKKKWQLIHLVEIHAATVIFL